MRVSFRVIAAGLCAAASTSGAPAFSQIRVCPEPRPPFCITGFNTFDNDFAFQQCRNDMERYRREVDDFRRCAVASANDALDEFNRNVERFNCRARGNSFCP